MVRSDLYPDALPCVERLRGGGFVLGAAGNHAREISERAQRFLSLDLAASSETLGVEKPDIVFFRRLAALAHVDPEESVYVGDRLDNDVIPALKIGMFAVFIRRGPWGHLHADWPEAKEADLRIDSLSEPEALVAVGKQRG